MTPLHVLAVVWWLGAGWAQASQPDGRSHEALALVEEVTAPAGCAPRLLGQQAHGFIEAQIACDVFLGLALVDEALVGNLEGARAAAAVRRLLVDAQGRGRLPFARSPASVLRRGYELLLYSGLSRLGALKDEEGAAFDQLARSVAADVERAAPAFVESFHAAYWPCDSAPAAAGLVLHGSLRRDEHTRAAGLQLAQRLERLRASKGGFVTKVDRVGHTLEGTPRGTVMAWTAGFLAVAGLPMARAFADDFFARFCAEDVRLLGVVVPASCREWPRGVDRKPDAVSGPIVDGQGMGASALGIAALRASGRAADADKLSAMALMARQWARLQPSMRVGPLERAILLWGASAQPWLPNERDDPGAQAH
jgi:hypothetical protein